MSGFLDDFETGEVLRADALQGLSDAVAGLSMKLGLVDVAAAGGGGVVEYDGGVAWPWQVMECEPEGELCLQVAAGEVLVGGDWQRYGPEGSAQGGWKYEMTAADVLPVSGFSASGGAQVVWLAMTGEVEVRATGGEGYVERVMQMAVLKDVEMVAVSVPVGEQPAVAGALRVWPLAVWMPEHEQRLTQLQWGELSAVECTGLVDENGEVVWPADRAEAVSWGTAEHAAGMARLCAVDFSTPVETISGELRGCVDADGALEFYLGCEPAQYYDGPGSSGGGTGESGMEASPEDEEEENDSDDSWPDGGDVPGWDDEDDEPVGPDEKVAVRIGYEAGDGFSSCELVRRGGGYYWKLVLDGDYVAAALMGVDVPGKVTFKANGTQEGTEGRTVEMGLGGVSASASDGEVSGSAALVFHGTNAVDASKKEASVKVAHVMDARMAPPKKVWYLSPRSSSSAGAWVNLRRSTGLTSFHVRAAEWWTWSVDVEKLKAAARTELQRALAEVSVSGGAVSVSEDSTVTGTLSGNALDMVASAILS